MTARSLTLLHWKAAPKRECSRRQVQMREVRELSVDAETLLPAQSKLALATLQSRSHSMSPSFDELGVI